MADAFQSLKSALNRGITTINVKTSSSLEKSKIKTHIESLTRDIEREISAVGEAAYKLWSDGPQDFSPLESYFETIRSKYDEIARLNEQLNAIDDRDNQILGNTTQEVREVVAPKFVCTNCGAQYENPVKFCRKCGNKMAE